MGISAMSHDVALLNNYSLSESSIESNKEESFPPLGGAIAEIK